MNQERSATVYRILHQPANEIADPVSHGTLGICDRCFHCLALFHLYRLAIGAVGIIAPWANVPPTYAAAWRFANRKARMARSHNRTRPLRRKGHDIGSHRIKLDPRLNQRWQKWGSVCTGRSDGVWVPTS